MSDQSEQQARREIAVNAALHTARRIRGINPEESGEDYERFVMSCVVDTVLARPECDLRIAAHHEKRSTEELDAAGVEKYDQEDRADSTDDSAGQQWSTWKRVRFLRQDRDRLRRALERCMKARLVTPNAAWEGESPYLIARAALGVEDDDV